SVIRLTSKLEYPARYHHRNPFGGQLSYETLLCLSNGLQDFILSVEGSEDSSGDVAFEAASDFSVGFLFGLSFCHVSPGFCIVGHFADRHHVQGTIQRAITTTIQTVSDGVPRRCWDGIDTGQGREFCLCANTSVL